MTQDKYYIFTAILCSIALATGCNTQCQYRGCSEGDTEIDRLEYGAAQIHAVSDLKLANEAYFMLRDEGYLHHRQFWDVHAVELDLDSADETTFPIMLSGRRQTVYLWSESTSPLQCHCGWVLESGHIVKLTAEEYHAMKRASIPEQEN